RRIAASSSASSSVPSGLTHARRVATLTSADSTPGSPDRPRWMFAAQPAHVIPPTARVIGSACVAMSRPYAFPWKGSTSPKTPADAGAFPVLVPLCPRWPPASGLASKNAHHTSPLGTARHHLAFVDH